MLRLLEIKLFRMQMKTRMPFRYGIAELKELPHVFLSLEAEIDGKISKGIASDHLPPLWFTKNPDQPPDSEIAEMLRVIRNAVDESVGNSSQTVFDWWLDAYERQMAWADEKEIPKLLAHFGLTLVERALISAFCQRYDVPFHTLLRNGAFGFSPHKIYPELLDYEWRNALPRHPASHVILRHTVGLSDPIFENDVLPDLQLADGLPKSLEANIRTYGLRHFKIKLCGDVERDRERLRTVLHCIESNAISTFAFSLDGNESYPDLETFRQQWQTFTQHSEFQRHREKLLFVEQPIHRDRALDSENTAGLVKLAGIPITIDESDASLDSLPHALEVGYCGTSHKNCKGVFKGLAAKCLLAFRQQSRSNSVPPLLQSGEDLSNIGPVALLQDLTVMASLGITSVERNGHHYFTGLSAFSDALNQEVLSTLPDLFSAAPLGYAKLHPEGGCIHLEKLLRHPFAPHFNHTLDRADQLDISQKQTVH